MKRLPYILLWLLLGIIIGAVPYIYNSHKLTAKRIDRLTDRAYMQTLFLSVLILQETQWYEEALLKEESGIIYLGGQGADWELYSVLQDATVTEPEVGSLMHIPSQMVQANQFVNPWGYPYRVIIFDSVTEPLDQAGLPQGKNGSVVLILSDHKDGETSTFLSRIKPDLYFLGGVEPEKWVTD